MAEEKAEAKAEAAPTDGNKKSSLLVYILLVLNMLFLGAAGFMLYKSKSKQGPEATLDQVVEAQKGEGKPGEHGTAEQGPTEEHKEFLGKMVPLEMFLVNLAGAKGNKLLKVTLELEVDSEKVQEEIDKRKPQIRDIIIVLLSSKTYQGVSTPEGKEILREEVKDTLNSFLTTGKVSKVLFTEFIFN